MHEPLVWKIETRKLSSLNGWSENPRKMTEVQFEKLKKRIKERGFHDILKIDVDGTIVSGNHRQQALKDLGYDEVDVKVPNRPLTEKERKEVALESNIQMWFKQRENGVDGNIL